MNHVIVRVPRDPDTCLKNLKNFLEHNVKNHFFQILNQFNLSGFGTGCIVPRLVHPFYRFRVLVWYLCGTSVVWVQ